MYRTAQTGNWYKWLLLSMNGMNEQKGYKESGEANSYSLNSKMLKATGTFLVLVLSSYTCLCETENLSESCGCTIETVDSFNNQRIPSRVTELYCAQPGAPCVSDHYRVNQNVPYFL